MRRITLFTAFLTLLTISCRKTDQERGNDSQEASKSTKNTALRENAKRVKVSSVEELYAAVNDPANEGTTIVLSPGTYALSPNHPKGGRIELAHNMSLAGQSGNINAVVIDVSGLPAASFVVPPTPTYPAQLRTGPIRVGNGYNAIEWITFTNDPKNILRSMIQTDIVARQSPSDPAPLARVRIAHTVIQNSSIGLNILNRDAVSDGRVVEAEVENNEILNNTQPQFGSGIQIQNSQRVTGAQIRVNLRGNYIHGNGQGIDLFNQTLRENNRIIVRSISDRIEGNGLGLALSAGLNTISGASNITDNYIRFEAEGTSIRNNGFIPSPLDNYIPGGIFIAGANLGDLLNSTGIPGTLKNNKVEAIFKGCKIEDNAGNYQINVFGAYSSLPFPLPAGTNNSAVVTLLGVSKKATVNAVPSYPAEPAGTNTVRVSTKPHFMLTSQ